MIVNVTASAMRSLDPRRSRLVGRSLLAAALLAAVLVGSRGITDEGAVFLIGDMPRYVMDGVFLYDALGSGTRWTVGSAVSYAQQYFARYPALSLGHHPPLLAASLVPFYAVFGVSILAARVAILAFFVLSVVLLYTLVDRLYDEEVAGWACLLFASSPIVATFAQAVLSEMPALALALAALNAILWFRDTCRTRSYVLFVVSAVMSLLARQLTVLMFPAYLALLMDRGGWSRLVSRPVIVVTLAAALPVALIGAATLVYAPFNVAVVRDVFGRGLVASPWTRVFVPMFRAQLLPVLGLVTAAGIVAAIVKRDRRIMVPVYWILAVLGGVLLVTGSIEPARYSINVVPAYCLCAGSLACAARTRGLRLMLTAVLTVAVVGQLWAAKGTHPSSNGAYEEAARFVLADSIGPAATVLYSSSIDTGYFVFFVRKHDPAQRLVVLRADKLLTTSMMGRVSVEDRIGSPKEIYPLLDRYGTRFIVIEDWPSGSVVLDWLRDELKGDRFIERRRIPFDARSALGGASLVVYEYKGARSPDPDAVIDLKLPLVGREIRVPLRSLLPTEPR